ncbi:MAG: MBOAT family protein [Planctomycetaceae bacterium]|nr:MBOAT family protein [Planctomycetaceae bacterium]
MLFHSLTFALFFAPVFALYCALDQRRQNALLLAASLYFYGAWDVRFLGLLIASASIDYIAALRMAATCDMRLRRRWLRLSLAGNFGILGFFKYCNFFVGSFQELLGSVGFATNSWAPSIVLPVGISFYTFQAVSYAVDVYRGELQPIRRYGDYLLFVTFFPQLVAGPIERAGRLIPQILGPRRMTWDGWCSGSLLLLIGLFKKMAVADMVAPYADRIFESHRSLSAATLWFGLYCFALQIYADFSGYSDMARGLARILGFELVENFRQPYFAANITDFWRRWHVSLSEWLRDYVYIPLGGNRGGKIATYRNLLATMLLGGFWHGASWNFVAWGGFHGLMLALHKLWTSRGAPASAQTWIPRPKYLSHGRAAAEAAT